MHTKFWSENMKRRSHLEDLGMLLHGVVLS